MAPPAPARGGWRPTARYGRTATHQLNEICCREFAQKPQQRWKAFCAKPNRLNAELDQDHIGLEASGWLRVVVGAHHHRPRSIMLTTRSTSSCPLFAVVWTIRSASSVPC